MVGNPRPLGQEADLNAAPPRCKGPLSQEKLCKEKTDAFTAFDFCRPAVATVPGFRSMDCDQFAFAFSTGSPAGASGALDATGDPSARAAPGGSSERLFGPPFGISA